MKKILFKLAIKFVAHCLITNQDLYRTWKDNLVMICQDNVLNQFSKTHSWMFSKRISKGLNHGAAAFLKKAFKLPNFGDNK